MTDYAELIRAVASLLWPTLGFAGLLVFRKNIAEAIGRLRKASVLGHSVELRDQLQELQESADHGSEAIAGRRTDRGSNQDATRSPPSRDDHRVQEILQTSAQSPRAALMLLASEIERKGREALANTGVDKAANVGVPLHLPFRQVIKRLGDRHELPAFIPRSLNLFLKVRNRIVHGGFAEDPEIMSALDSGILIYRTLETLADGGDTPTFIPERVDLLPQD